MSETLTRHIRIRVQPEYLPEQSMPQVQRWLFAYHVSIENLGSYAVQLLNRHWVITNGAVSYTHLTLPTKRIV